MYSGGWVVYSYNIELMCFKRILMKSDDDGSWMALASEVIHLSGFIKVLNETKDTFDF